MDNQQIEIIKKTLEEQEVKNVAIFVDYDNIYYGLKDYALDLNDNNFCVFNLMNIIYTKNKIRTMRAYADFDQVNDIKLKVLQEKRVQIRNVYGNGKEEQYRKNASDIELSIDAIETYYKNREIDTFVFITADSDMIPIMSRMIYKGKKVHLYYIDENTSQYQNITNYSHLNLDILKILEIPLERKKPEYWVNDVINLIDEWYKNPNNSNKMLGGKWLNDELQKNLHMSQHLASITIQYMEENDKVQKTKKRKLEGYVIKTS
ncbi:NYN domain-containing protein [Haloimpatiens lingqiaonensis]|uniref:NYN domain-containing protein n=1 Tax=Haloimpatiens lingqiaonensis TaxID=1380675 RepID=UPI001FAA5661|nr:NYN domain-containing protein [Haloimpatiens lingqiaonensis]